MQFKMKNKPRGLRQRWMTNSMSMVTIIMLIACSLFSASVGTYYYSNVQTAMQAQAKAAISFMNRTTINSYEEYYTMAYNYTQSFSDKDKLELQFIDESGKVETSSYNFTAGISPETPDIATALGTGEPDSFVGRDNRTGEKIVAVSYPLSYDGAVIGAMRYVTSTRLIDQQILLNCALIFGVGFAMLVMVFISNIIFIRNIVEPVAEVTEAVQHISSGSYGLQIENTYKEEIGALVDSINEMSTKISQNEKMQREFISSVSHELRTPLAGLRIQAEVIALLDDDAPARHEAVAAMLQAIDRCGRLAEQLLALSRLEAFSDAPPDSGGLTREPVDWPSLLDEALAGHCDRLDEKDLAVSRSILSTPCGLTGYLPLLRLLLRNALDNAVRYTPQGGSIRIDLTSAALTIANSGPSLPPEQFARVGERFFRPPGQTERGSGLGCSIMCRIARLHGFSLHFGPDQEASAHSGSPLGFAVRLVFAPEQDEAHDGI